MAKSGSFVTNLVGLELGTIGIEFSWSSSDPDIASNTTQVSWQIRGYGTYPYRVLSGPIRVYINNGIVYQGYTDNSNRLSLAVGDVIARGSFTANHNDEGNYSFTATVHSFIYYLDVPGNPSQDGSGNWSLDRIPRKSTLTASGGTLGTQQNLVINKAAQSFTHTITYSCGSASGTVADNTPAGVINWTPPYSLASQAPSATVLLVTLTLSTYSGEILVGSNIYSYVYVIPDNADTKPTFSLSISPVQSLPEAFSGMYVQWKTRAMASYTEATAKYGASVRSYVFSVDGKSYSGNGAVSGILSQSGQLTVVAYITDSRGFSSAPVYSYITVIPYSKPNVIPYTGAQNIECYRATESGEPSRTGTYLRIRAGRQFSTIIEEGEQKNFCILRYRYKQSDSTLYSGWTTLLSKNATGNFVDVTVAGILTSDIYSYDIQIGVEDDIGEVNSVTLKALSRKVTLHLGRNGDSVGIGRMAHSSPGRLDCDLDAYFEREVSVRGQTLLDLIYPIGSIYMSVSNVSPQTFFGGTWVRIEDVFLLSAGENHEAGSTGGSEEVTLTIEEIPPHVHQTNDTLVWPFVGTGESFDGWRERTDYYNESSKFTFSTGGGQPHNNMPPYLAVYMWKRTA